MTAMKTIFLEPSDVWLFRNATPFTAAEQNRAVSLFPPSPRTIQGAIRSARLAASGEPFGFHRWSPELRAEIGQPEDFGALRCRGPVVARRQEQGVELLFPWPQDVMKSEGRGWHVLTPQSRDDVSMNWPTGLLPLLPPEDDCPEKFEPHWLPKRVLSAYLSRPEGGLPAQDLVPAKNVSVSEPRFGVEIDSRPKRPHEGMLFQVEFVRLGENVGLLVEFSGVTLPDSGVLQLGGESRAARYTTVPATLQLDRKDRLPTGVRPLRFKLYLATPAIFHGGWLPQWLDATTRAGRFNRVPVRLVAAAVGKPQPMGGRDIARGDQQRTLRRAVPAGSVYFFETEATPQEVLDDFDGQCLSDVDREIGFGLAYVGGW